MKAEYIIFFGNEDVAQNKCKLLAENYDKTLEWESLSVSEFSPGIVKNAECIARQIFYPMHIDDDGEIKTVAFDDAFNKGLSINRLDYADEKDIHQLGESKAERDRLLKPERKYIGFVEASVSHFRTFFECDKRAYAIFDTATEDVFHHADVCVIIFGPINCKSYDLPKKAALKNRRFEMKKIFSNIFKSNLLYMTS